MIKVTHLITGLDSGGAEVMLYKLLKHTDKSRFASKVISLTDIGPVGKKMQALGINIVSLGMSRGVPHPFGLLRLVRLLRKEKPDVLQTWLYHADFLGLIAGKLSGVPSIVWNLRCSDLSEGDTSWTLSKILTVMTHFSNIPDAVVVNSVAGKIVHERLGYKPLRWECIPNGFDMELFAPSKDARLELRRELGLSPHTRLVGLIAHYHRIKDHLNFLKAAQRLSRIHQEVQYVFAGRGVSMENKKLVDQISSLGLDGKVHLLGDRTNIHKIFAALDILVSASYSEGFSNVIGEAMASEVTCVVTDVGDSADMVGAAGKVVPPRDPVAMADALDDLLSRNNSDFNALSVSARKRIASLFSIESIVNRYEELYNELFERSKQQKA
jgi:glycosyltransferase involved in cell wall biosynthesis